MILTKSESLKGVMELRDDFDLFLECFWGKKTAAWARYNWKPSAEISENNDNIVLKTEVPGVKKEKLRILVGHNTLVVYAEVGKEMEKNYHTGNLHSCNFRRSFFLPASVNRSEIEAMFINGLLQITMPKTVETETAKVNIFISDSTKKPAFTFNTLPGRRGTDGKR